MNFDENCKFLYEFAPAFFSMTRQSIQDTLIIQTINLLEDKGRSDYNLIKYIDNLIKAMEENSYQVPREIILIQEFLVESKKKITESLKTWRDKSLVHLDKEYFIDSSKLSIDVPVKFDDLQEVITILFKYLCDAYYHFFKINKNVEMDYRSDYKNLFILEKHYKDRIKNLLFQIESESEEK
jgi:hypothetical protein